MKEFDYSTIPHYKFYGGAMKVFGSAFKRVYHMKFKYTENIPKDGKYIVALNHTCALDPVFVALADGMPELHFMAKAELFENPVVAWVITHLYGFPVKRGQGDTTAIDYAKKIINEGHILAISPEGKRIKDKNGVPQKAKAGVALISRDTGADILPVAICCKNKIKKGEHVTVCIGELIKAQELGIDENSSREEIKDAANIVMEKISQIRERELSGN